MRRCLAVAVALILSAGIAQAARAPAPDPLQGDGRVSSFYTWTDEIPAEPGRMLRTESLEPTLGLAMAGRQVRILYSSTDGVGGKTPVAVSGAYFAPKGAAPAGGWPLIAWAHGTTGVADICAPSWQARSYRDVTYLNHWLEQGYAIVATDYQGLGTPGPHPYLAVRPEAYSVLDSVRAVRGAFSDVANRVVVVGQSQGGGATIAALGFAPDYAPELDIRGGVATGAPYFTPETLRRIPDAVASSAERADPMVAYTLYIGLVALQRDPALLVRQLVTERGLPVLDLARTACVGPLFGDAASAGLNYANALTLMFREVFAALLPSMQYPTVKLRFPVFIGTGEQDRDVPPPRQLALVKDACAAGTVVEAHLYAGLNHGATVNASFRDSLPFVRKVMAGDAVAPVCEPRAE